MAVNSEDLVRRGKELLHRLGEEADDGERQVLKAEFYEIADELFPEAARLRRAIKNADGEDRRALKKDYVKLVHRLWAEKVGKSDSPRKDDPKQKAAIPPSAPKRSFVATAVIGVVALLLGVGGAVAFMSSRTVPPSDTVAELIQSPAPEIVQEATPVEEATPAVAASEVISPSTEPEESSEPVDTVVVEYEPLPATLEGKGDSITVDGERFADVYVRESGSAYYVQFPETGAIQRVSLSEPGLEVSLGEKADRDAIREIWQRNRDAVAKAEEERERLEQEAEEAKRREIMMAKRDEERQRAVNAEIARWKKREEEWSALSADERDRVRAQLYGNWRAVYEDISKAEELYERIGLLYEFLGIHQARRLEVTDAYKQIRSVRGPRYDVEDALIQAGLEEQEGQRIAAEWEAEYRELTRRIATEFPRLETEVNDIQRLDAALSPAMLGREDSFYDWESPWEDPVAGSSSDSEAVGFGTGFIVAKNYVMTCEHVLDSARVCKVISTSGQEFEGVVNQRDRSNDWCLIKVDDLDAPPIPVSITEPNVGATIHCVGYPLAGLRKSIEPVAGSGNIAALQRYDGDARFLQVTAPLNPGNSGGPLLDAYGRWIGIVSQKLDDSAMLAVADNVAQGFNFATKAEFVEKTLDTRRGVKFYTQRVDESEPLTLEQIVANVKPSIVKIEVSR